MTRLRGITWMHSRGNIPVMATAQRYMETHSDVSIAWESRSLQEFGDFPIDQLAKEYDLIILDHPWMGFADHTGALFPLEEYLDRAYLDDQKKNSVGRSFQSYCYNGHQYALAIDAACPVAFYSPDKLKRFDTSLPFSWEEVMSLARRGGVISAGNATSLLMQFYMFCATITDQLFTDDEIADRSTMQEALENIQALFQLLPNQVFSYNPIAVYEILASSEGAAAYCPCDFGYSNYSRLGYADTLVLATNVTYYQQKMLKTTLGGAGIAISSKCRCLDQALDYVQYTCSDAVQCGIYAQNGGQPGYRAAWMDEKTNNITNNFFSNTLQTIDNAFLRPRYCGYLEFQETAGAYIRDWMTAGGSVHDLMDKLTKLYHCSLMRCKNDGKK